MDEKEAATVLLALGKPLEWRQFRGRYAVIPPEGEEGLFTAKAPEPSAPSYWVESRAERHFLSYEVDVGKTDASPAEKSPIAYKTLGAAKTACEIHRATGAWGTAVGKTLTWYEESGGVHGGVAGEDAAYYQVVPYRAWRWRFWLPREERFAAVIGRADRTRNECHRGHYRMPAAARAACERHFATGRWT